MRTIRLRCQCCGVEFDGYFVLLCDACLDQRIESMNAQEPSVVVVLGDEFAPSTPHQRIARAYEALRDGVRRSKERPN